MISRCSNKTFLKWEINAPPWFPSLSRRAGPAGSSVGSNARLRQALQSTHDHEAKLCAFDLLELDGEY